MYPSDIELRALLELTQEQLESKITSKFAIVKNRYEARIESLQKIFKEHINDFISKVES